MRQTISAIIAVIGFAIAGAAPAMACGYTPCGVPAQAYQPYAYQPYAYQPYAYPLAPVYPYQPPYACGAGCGHGHAGHGYTEYGYGYGATYERLAEPTYEPLAEPTTRYYYVNQGPTFTGPGRFAPYPTYRESAVTGYGYPRRHHYYHGAGVEGPAVYGHGGHRTATRWSTAGYYHGKRVLRRYN
jgi:hypothetical protein